MTDQPNPRCGAPWQPGSPVLCSREAGHDGYHSHRDGKEGWQWRYEKTYPSPQVRCGGTPGNPGTFPLEGGDRGTTRWVCPGCPDCQPAIPGGVAAARRALIEHFTGDADDERDSPCEAVDEFAAAIRAESAAEVERLTAALRDARDAWRLANEAAERLLPIANRAEAAEQRAASLDARLTEYVYANERVMRQYLAAEQRLRLAPLCDEHGSGGGVRTGCLVCSLQELHAALSRIDYLCGEPNDMEVSGYDVHCDETAVVRHVEQRLREVEAERDRLRAAADEVRNQLWRYTGGRSARARAINAALDAAHTAASRPVPASATDDFGPSSDYREAYGVWGKVDAAPAATPEKEQPRA